VSAAFTISRFPLTVTLSGTGAGAVVLPDGSSCSLALGQTSATCTAQVNAGANVSVAATPTIESTFEGFTGDCTGRGGCSFVMTAPRVVGVTLTRKQVSLTLQLRGPGGGSVSVNGAVACTIVVGQSAATCTRQVDYGMSVALTASPTTESSFNGFDSDCAGGTCVVPMTANRIVGATFSRRLVPLVLTLSGPESGSVRINGIAECTLLPGVASISCTKMLEYGATVIITGRSTSSFNEYVLSGDCSGAPGTAPTCSLTMIGPRAVGIAFR